MSGRLPEDAGVVVPRSQSGHSLGPVLDDWAAIDVWLSAVADNSRSGGSATIETYRYHLAKLRWYWGSEVQWNVKHG